MFMQFIRMLGMLILLVTTFAYTFMLINEIFLTINFYSLIFTFFAITFLFFGAGKQMVYQKLILQKKRMSEVTLWWWGLFFYNLAIPTTIAANMVGVNGHVGVVWFCSLCWIDGVNGHVGVVWFCSLC